MPDKIEGTSDPEPQAQQNTEEAGGSNQQPPKQDIPDTVSRKDFDNLKSVYDTRLAEQAKAFDEAQSELATVRSELDLVKKGIPQEQGEFLKRSRELSVKEQGLNQRIADLEAQSLDLKARELLLQFPDSGLAKEELVKLKTPTEMELAVLRKVTEPKAPKPNVPAAGSLQKTTGSQGSPASGDEALLREIEKAKKLR